MDKNKKYTMKAYRNKIRKYVEKRDSYFTRTDSDEDSQVFTQEIILGHQIIPTPYDTHRMYTIAEQSDIVRACVDAMVKNVDGFGYKLQHLGDDLTSDNEKEKETLKNQLDQANEKQSFMTLRKLLRGDREVLGYGGLEAIRDRDKKPVLFYHTHAQNLRMTIKQKKPVDMEYLIMRNGELLKITIKKRFRKFVKVLADGTLRFYKELGDLRDMNYITGEYGSTQDELKASELWFFKNEFGMSPYGCPKWVSNIMDVVGRRKAQYVNMDLLDSQGIPPLLFLVSDGVLTDDSVDELENILDAFRGYQRFNKVGYLTSQSTDMSMDGSNTKSKIEVKNLADFRSEDMMFQKYLKTSGDDIRHTWRLPDIYVGLSDYTHASSNTAQVIAEEQIFIPERAAFDEEYHFEMTVSEFGIRMWKMVSKGPKIVGSAQITKGVTAFKNAGALSVNASIELANTAFGTEISLYDQEWAKYPVPIVIELLKAGNLNLDGVDTKIMESMPKDLKVSDSADLGKDQKEMLKTLTFLNELREESEAYDETGI